MKKEKGFTLLELMIVIAIMGIIVAMALPSYRSMLINNKIRTAISEWQGSFYLAQAEAMRIKGNVILCPSQLGTKCDDVGYEKGWIVAIGDKDNPNKILKDELPSDTPGLKMSLNGNGGALIFTANGNIGGGFMGRTLCVSIEKKGEGTAQRAVMISSEGRIRISAAAQELNDKCSKLSN